ncbi:hypothetical protein GC722_05325 [Auraticoccus sp. F435]|uniref:Uncharacterized protein n=1 Tax=Auraticoccus cholistanensis TaxID=2656650 RepID=A0A6A9URX2_9ACTN|nr:hypothetical protein [Auraticoccus cholistanensis]MVA75451.1 hypothetical protein [Auraticoccus cholistanensis]
MTVPPAPNGPANPGPGRVAHEGSHGRRRLTTETKAAFKTTEFIFYVLVSVAVLIAAAVTDNGDDGQGFGAQSAWFYVTLLTIGYMVSRGLAKSGSRERYDD